MTQLTTDPRQRLGADLMLLTTALIWGSTFVAQRVAAAQIGVFLFNGLRFGLGALVVLLFLRRRVRGFSARELRGGALLGLLVFVGAALQQASLQFTTAGKAGFITGMYVVLVPLFLAIFFRRSPALTTWLAALMAAAGLFLLSATEDFRLAPGDGLVLLSAFAWAFQVIVVERLAKEVSALRLAFAQYLVVAVLSLSVALFVDLDTVGALAGDWWTVGYAGILSVGVAYTLQVVAQRVAPAADAAILMSLEAVFAALFGWIFLAELLTPRQLFGCGLMLAAMILAQGVGMRRNRRVVGVG